MVPRIVGLMVQRGSELVSMLPGTVEHWLKLVEDVHRSPYVVDLQRALLDEAHEHGEFEHITMDATLRIVRRIKGQADYRSPKDVRDVAPIPDADAKRRVLTVLGRTSCVIGMDLVKDEASPEIAAALGSELPQHYRAQTLSVSTDQPTERLFTSLKTVLVNFRFLALDPVHLAIVYEQSHGNKKTAGSRALRIIMAKFSKASADLHPGQWGPIYCGRGVPALC